jgi:putative oxidoreductase
VKNEDEEMGGLRMEWLKAFAMLIGRIVLVLIFLKSGIGKIENFAGTAQYMAKAGMPYTTFFLLGAIFIEIVCSTSVILGFLTRLGTLLLLLFLIPTTLIFHGNLADHGQMIHFMKNLSMLGGLLVLLAVGPGQLSLDHLFRGRKRS